MSLKNLLLEVEQKYPLADREGLLAKLRAWGIVPEEIPAILQVDQYFAHPARDFAQTDEALRIRRVGEQNFVTYKGPKLDAATKTRRELELPLPPGDVGAASFAELLSALGFTPVAEVRKQRRSVSVDRAGQDVELAWDQVEGVGEFVEIEIITNEAGLSAVKACLAKLAVELGLEQQERRSYLELLLAKRAS